MRATKLGRFAAAGLGIVSVGVVLGVGSATAGADAGKWPAPTEPAPTAPSTQYTVPLTSYLSAYGVSSSSSCSGSDQTAALQDALTAAFDAYPTDATFVFPSDQCFVVQGTITLQDTDPGATPDPGGVGTVPTFLSDDVIDGDGSTFDRTQTPSNWTWAPELAVLQTSDLEIEDLNIDGPGTPSGANGSGNNEGLYGVFATADVGLTLYQVDMQSIGGDFFDVVPVGDGDAPVDQECPSGATTCPYLGHNEDVTATDCDWVGAGFHGVSIADLLTGNFNGDEIDKTAVDAVVFEYDGTHDESGYPDNGDYPQDNVTFADDVFYNDTDAVVAVSNSGNDEVEQLAFKDNELVGNTNATFQIDGQAGSYKGTGGKPHPLQVQGLTIQGDFQTGVTEAAGPPSLQSETEMNDITLEYVTGAVIDDDDFTYNVDDAGQQYQDPVAMDDTDSGVQVEDDQFVGAQVPVDVAAGAGQPVECGTIYSGSPSDSGQITQGPCGVSASAGDGQVTVSWLPEYPGATSEWGYNSLAGYQPPEAATPGFFVYVATTSGGEDYDAAAACNTGTPDDDDGNPISCTVTGLTDGTTYYFTVEGLYGYGGSTPSAEVTATPEPAGS